MNWFSVDRQMRYLQQLIGKAAIWRANPEPEHHDPSTHLPPDADLSEREQHAAIEHEAEQRQQDQR